MSVKEKQLYGIVLVLAVALAGVSGYLVAILQQSQLSQSEGYEIVSQSKPSPYTVQILGQGGGMQLNTIAVSGLGRAAGKPNQAVLRLGATTEASNATEAIAKNAESMNQVIEALKAMGIPEKDIETSRFSLYPRYSHEGTLIGFEVTHMLRVTTTNLDRVGEIIDGAVEAGANRVEGVYFTFTKDKVEELNTLARQRAVEDARAKAETIADSLMVNITGVASAEETGYYPSPYRGVEMAVPAAPPTPIMPPAEVEVTVMVMVTFIIE